jgi:EAL domain-containing protein (putative c-di-GMP-specific phosphodiesterase class I)
MQVTAAEIRQALDQGEFRFFYQPKVSFLTGQVSGAEALIRWQRDERTIVPPDAFIPVALAHGLVPEITQSMFPRLVEDFQRIRNVNAAYRGPAP